jgi:hypothetical protein
MMKSLVQERVPLIALVSLILGFTAGGIAYAVFPDTDVETFTGCLNVGGSSGGQLSQLALGLNPAKPCGNNQRLVRLGGGDITAVRTATGSGLSGGTENGAASLSLAGGYQLPQTCSNGQVPSQSNGSWACANVDPSVWFADSGIFGMDDEDDGIIVSLSLPAGTYLVTMTGTAYNVSAGAQLDMNCFVQNSYGGLNYGGTVVADFGAGGRAGGSIAGHGISSSTQPFTVEVYCETFTDNNALGIQLSAIRVGTVTDQSPES